MNWGGAQEVPPPQPAGKVLLKVDYCGVGVSFLQTCCQGWWPMLPLMTDTHGSMGSTDWTETGGE